MGFLNAVFHGMDIGIVLLLERNGYWNDRNDGNDADLASKTSFYWNGSIDGIAVDNMATAAAYAQRKELKKILIFGLKEMTQCVGQSNVYIFNFIMENACRWSVCYIGRLDGWNAVGKMATAPVYV